MYRTIQDLIDRANASDMSLSQIILNNEIAITHKSEQEVYSLLEKHYEVMIACSQKALGKP